MDSLERCLGAAISLILVLITASFPQIAKAQDIVSFEGIEIPVSKFKAARGGEPTKSTYYVYHFKPKSDRPAPYLVYIPSSTTEVFGSDHLRIKNAKKMVDYGYGVIAIDINRNIKGSKEYNGLVGAPPRAIGALSAIQYIIDNYPALSNGKFGAWGHSLGGETTIEINKKENQIGQFLRGGSGNLDSLDKWNFCLRSA